MSSSALPTEAQAQPREDSPNPEMRPGPIICPGHSRPIPDVSYSRVIEDGYFIISAGLDKKPMLRRGDTGDWVGTFEGHKGAVWTARLNTTADKAISASGDFTACMWDAVTGKRLHEFSHKHIVRSGVFSCDTSYAITGGAEKVIRIFDLTKPEADPMIVVGHGATIGSLASLPCDRNLFLSAGDENNIRLWDIRLPEKEAKLMATTAPVASMEVSWCGMILTVTTAREVQFWNLESFDLVKSFKLERQLKCASLHPEKKTFVAGSMEELWVRVYDYDSGEEIDCRKGHHGPVRSIAFSPLGNAYASGSEDGTIRIWDH